MDAATPMGSQVALDDLDSTLAAAEGEFRALGLGVPVMVFLDDGRELAFRKRAGRWGFYVRPGARTPWRPLLASSKALRVQAAARLRDLFDALLDAAEEEHEAVLAATATVRGLLVAFEEGKRL